MAVYLQSTDEENLYVCIHNGLWGSRNNKLANWVPDDKIIVYVDRQLAALFTVRSESFYDETPCWRRELYPYRVKIDVERIIPPGNRYSISSSQTRELLFRHHTRSYGVTVVLNAKPLHEEAAEHLLDIVLASPDWENFDPEEMISMLLEEQAEEFEEIAEEIVKTPSDPAHVVTDSFSHTQMQLYLAKLGISLGYDVWIPKGDQNKIHDEAQLSELSLSELPSLPYNRRVLRIIENIDVIWLADEHPSHLFEVEHTTAIYSGLLRMSDFTSLIPSINIQMFICASEERRRKVIAEITRPTFERLKVPLRERCRYISFEKLAEFIEAEEDRYLTHFNVSVLDELSESIERPPDRE